MMKLDLRKSVSRARWNWKNPFKKLKKKLKKRKRVIKNLKNGLKPANI